MTHRKQTIRTLACWAALAWASNAALAQSVEVRHAWVRATVPGQQATGAFMQITSREGGRLVAVSTPVAGVAEVHEMNMQDGVMRMHAVEGGLELPAGKPVLLQHGGYHLMLMDLKRPLPKDSSIALTLTVRDAKGHESRTTVKLAVATVAPVEAGPASHP